MAGERTLAQSAAIGSDLQEIRLDSAIGEELRKFGGVDLNAWNLVISNSDDG